MIEKYWKTFLGIEVAVIILALLSLAAFGLKLGIDFTGGSLVELKFPNAAPAVSQLREQVEEVGFSEVQIQKTSQGSYIFRLKELTPQNYNVLRDSLKERYSEIEERRFDTIGPVIGEELKRKAIIATIIALLMIVIFVAWAFRQIHWPVPSWQWGLVTLVALFHDVSVTLGVFAILGKFQTIEIGAPFVAAILTVVGYSVNDTIIVLDRIREILRIEKRLSFDKIVNRGVRQTLTRSINTSMTTILVLLAIFIFGGPTLKMFVLALMVGIAAGTISSLFLASSGLILLAHRKKT